MILLDTFSFKIINIFSLDNCNAFRYSIAPLLNFSNSPLCSVQALSCENYSFYEVCFNPGPLNFNKILNVV